MPIKIRPHHLSTFDKTTLDYGTIDSLSAHKLGEVYGKDLLEHNEELIRRVKSGEPIEIVFGQDDICAKCPFDSSCRIGNYEPVKQALDVYYDKYKLKVSERARSIKNNPETADSLYKLHHKLTEGQVLTERELRELTPPNSI